MNMPNTIFHRIADRLKKTGLPSFARNEYFQTAILSIAVLIFCFPGFYPGISLGLDGSYVYAFNYFFARHIQLGAGHIFTYGPLVFMYAPNLVGHNLAIAIPAVCMLYLFFIYGFLLLGTRLNPLYRILHILLITGLCNIVCFDLIFPGCALIAVLNYHNRKNRLWLIAASFITAVAFLVKSSYGAFCITALMSYAVFMLYSTRRPRLLIFFASAVSFFIAAIWLVIYHSLSALPSYLYTCIIQVREYSGSLQLEDAVNHWGIFSAGIILFFLPLLFVRNSLTRLLYLISIIPLYVSFKYSFSREDQWHEAIILHYIIMTIAITLVIESDISRLALIMQLSSVAFIYLNMILASPSDTYLKGLTGIGNLNSWIIHYRSSVNRYRREDSANLQNRILNEGQRKIIGNAGVDCYPFEYTYIPANGLNWDPRPNLQLYISDRWIDSVNASFLNSDRAPRYYIWMQEEPPLNNYYCDNRYLLNEDPQSTYTFFDRYRLITCDGKTALFGHTAGGLLSPEKITGYTTAQINDWVTVPQGDSSTIVRARTRFKNTFKGALRRFLYRDQLYFIDYRLSTGTVKTYRFIPANAASGLWINPLVIDVAKGLKGDRVQAVRIRVSRKGCIEPRFQMTWTSFNALTRQY